MYERTYNPPCRGSQRPYPPPAASLSIQLRICILIARRYFDRRDLMESFQLKRNIIATYNA